jgi:hypothetical protein
MITAAETNRRHGEAWGNPAAYKRLPRLAEEVWEQIARGDDDPAHVINYAAILLDLHRDEEALEWLLGRKVDFKEYYQNLATAYAKTKPSDIGNIRKNNLEAAKHPECPHAIIAYIDYQGM